MRTYSEVLEVRISTYEFLGGTHNSTCNTISMLPSSGGPLLRTIDMPVHHLPIAPQNSPHVPRGQSCSLAFPHWRCLGNFQPQKSHFLKVEPRKVFPSLFCSHASGLLAGPHPWDSVISDSDSEGSNVRMEASSWPGR